MDDDFLVGKDFSSAAEREDIFLDSDQISILDKYRKPTWMLIQVERFNGEVFDRKVTAKEWDQAAQGSLTFKDVACGMQVGRSSARFYQT